MINETFYKAFGDGWKSLFEELLLELSQYDVEINEAKEKYGTLTVYAYSEKNNEEVQNILDKYEQKSKHICELCGNKGKMRNINNWLKVLCEECEEEYKRR